MWPLKWKLLSETVYCAVQGKWFKLLNLKMKSQSLSIQMKTNYAAALSCGTVYYAVQNGFNFWVCRWNPKVGPSSEIYWVVLCYLPCCTRWYKLLSLWMKSLSVHFKWNLLSITFLYVNYAVQGGSNLWECGWDPKEWPFKWQLLSSTFPWYCLLCCKRWF